jgi:hypothetical protein
LSKDPPHKIRVLEDTDGDGRFDTSRVFADKLVFPQGIVWHDGSVYCSSPPSFWRLTDTDGDGTADDRAELVTGFANTGVADDMHGGSVGPDGRLYWCRPLSARIRRPGGRCPQKPSLILAACPTAPARSGVRLAGQRRGRPSLGRNVRQRPSGPNSWADCETLHWSTGPDARARPR